MNMKKLLALTLGVVILAAFNGLSAAQQKGEEKIRPTGMEMKQPSSREKTMDKATPQLTKVKVLEVNDRAKTVTVMVKGTAFTFDANKAKSLPKPGELIGMWGDPTGQRLVCAVVECDMGWGSGPCIKCFDYQPQ